MRCKKIILLFFFVSYCSFHSYAQAVTPKKTALAVALDEVSANFQVYFTYTSHLLQDQFVDLDAFQDLSLSETIQLLQKVTPFQLEYLGNKYFVMYLKTTKNTPVLVRQQKKTEVKDSVFNKTSPLIKQVFKGIVISNKKTPLIGASILEEGTTNGTISLMNGQFSLALEKNNPVIVSYMGYTPQKISLTNTVTTITLQSGEALEEVHVIGSRNSNRAENDSPVATTVIDINAVSDKCGLGEVNQLLQYKIPSFNATKQSGADGADHIVPATYRGLGPDQTLVLINGKRRHQASLINLYGTRGRGNSGTDLNAIPVTAIKRIEFLQDGAAAQYGSDAIAGVINLVLNKSTDVLKVSSTVGFYNTDTDTNPKKIDGLSNKVAINYGVRMGESGFLNLTSEFLSTEHTYRSPTVQREKFGDAANNTISFFFNSEIPLTKKSRFYANGGYNYKDSKSYAFTRAPLSERNVFSLFPDGLNPLITSAISDKSISTGIQTSFEGWSIDLNNTFGFNRFHYTIKETVNATLLALSPTEFDAGGHQLLQNTSSVDFSKNFPMNFKGLNIAFGLEYRVENYQIFSGEEASYASYDVNGLLVDAATPTGDLLSYNGAIRPGGSQGFPGYSPKNEVNESRANFSFYLDSEFDFTKKWLLETALRYEHYSDFGSTLNTKIASRYSITPTTKLRGSFSTGFRAPSLAQIYYNLTFTNYIDSEPEESVLVANNNPLTRIMGIEKLAEEKAINASLGITTKLGARFSATIDGYYVAIKDRVILSGNFDASALDFNVSNVQFFANGVDTQTLGVDIKTHWDTTIGSGVLDLNLSGNINYMKIKKIHHKELDRETFFGVREQHFLLASAPKNKFNFSVSYQREKTDIGVHVTRYSAVTLIDWQIQQPLANFNNSIAERMAAATDYYQAQYTVDLHFKQQILPYLSYQVGVNNLLNRYPSVQGGHTDGGGLWDATQMGTNGRFFFSKLQLSL